MAEVKFSWVQTHKELIEFLKTKENSQKELVQFLKSVGIGPLNDKTNNGEYDIELDEMEPFTFFCYIYKYGQARRLEYLQKIAEKLNITIPQDECGLPSANPQKVWLFPYKYLRKNNEIKRLWAFFHKAISYTLSDSDFQDVFQIYGVGQIKLTEALFYVNPEKYLPINNPMKPYLKDVLGIETKFNTYEEYLGVLSQIKEKTEKTFCELSYEAWLRWQNKNKINHWVFQANTKVFNNVVNALREETLTDWPVNAHKDEIKVGDKIILWLTGTLSGCYALAEISSELQPKTSSPTDHLWEGEDKSSLKVDINIIHNLVDNPILSKEIASIEELSNLKVEHKERNFSATKEEYEVLLDLIQNRPIAQVEKRKDINFPLNTILYGPPGTGKTYHSVLRAAEIIENRKIDSYEEALKIFKANLHDQIEFITFHQNYSYEDFIQGLRPDTEDEKQLIFERKDGIFKIISDRALKNLKASEQTCIAKKTFEEVFNEFTKPLMEGEVEEIEVPMKQVSFFITEVSNKSIEYRNSRGNGGHLLSIATLKKMYDAESVLDFQSIATYYTPLLDELLKIGKDASGKKEVVERKNYVIIIDEINRANISRVFGELITLIEPDKRSHGDIPLETRLPSGETFIVPSNLYIIGTMNTADKSIALLDIALRRRFEFEPMYPVYEMEGQKVYDVEILRKLNEQIIKSKGYDFQIGHAYFMGKNEGLVQRMNKKVIPLLLEYYMNDEKEVKELLQSASLIIEENSWPLKIVGSK